MPEELPPNPELEALLQTSVESKDSLDAIEANTETSVQQLDNIEANTEANVLATAKLEDPLKQIAENTKTQGKVFLEGAQFITLKGEKGDTPEKGKDYFTEQEVEEFIRRSSPTKGKDYFTADEQFAFKRDVTPIKGVDYFDGLAGADGKDGRTPIFVSSREPNNAQIGDLWYQP